MSFLFRRLYRTVQMIKLFLLKTLIEKVKNRPLFISFIESILIQQKTELFVAHTVAEIISGYEDPLLKWAQSLNLVPSDVFSVLNGVGTL
jgi:hypothetical protein